MKTKRMRKLDWVELAVWSYGGMLTFVFGFFVGWKTPVTEDIQQSLLVIKITVGFGVLLAICCLYLVRQSRKTKERR